jgi:hypothetical protein
MNPGDIAQFTMHNTDFGRVTINNRVDGIYHYSVTTEDQRRFLAFEDELEVVSG